MSRDQPIQGLQPSVLDRLTDPESNGDKILIGYSVGRMSEAVARDLEDLLNSRQTHRDLLERLDEHDKPLFPDARQSVLNYGLPDLASMPAGSDQERNRIAELIREAIVHFEPRLRRVDVTLLEEDDPTVHNKVRFRIDARLCVDPAPDVAFDTILEINSGHYRVTQAGGA